MRISQWLSTASLLSASFAGMAFAAAPALAQSEPCRFPLRFDPGGW